jgi:hypothetical protein
MASFRLTGSSRLMHSRTDIIASKDTLPFFSPLDATVLQQPSLHWTTALVAAQTGSGATRSASFSAVVRFLVQLACEEEEEELLQSRVRGPVAGVISSGYVDSSSTVSSWVPTAFNLLSRSCAIRLLPSVANLRCSALAKRSDALPESFAVSLVLFYMPVSCLV